MMAFHWVILNKWPSVSANPRLRRTMPVKKQYKRQRNEIDRTEYGKSIGPNGMQQNRQRFKYEINMENNFDELICKQPFEVLKFSFLQFLLNWFSSLTFIQNSCVYYISFVSACLKGTIGCVKNLDIYNALTIYFKLCWIYTSFIIYISVAFMHFVNGQIVFSALINMLSDTDFSHHTLISIIDIR